MLHPRSVAAAAVAAIAMLVATACSGDDEPIATAAPPVTSPETDPLITSTAVPATTTTTTTAAETTTTVASTAPQTAPPTIVSPAETFPRTSLVTTDPETLAIADAVNEYYEARRRATRDPTNAALEVALLATTTGAASEAVAGVLANMREQQRALRPNPDMPARLDIIEESIAATIDPAGFATVSACDIATDRIVSPGTGPNGTDEVVADDVGTVVLLITLQNVDGRWIVSQYEVEQTLSGQLGCQ